MIRTFRAPLLCILSLGIAAAACAEDADSLLAGELDRMASAHYLPTVTATFGTFTYAYDGLPSPFARWLEDRLADAAARSTRVRLLNCSAAAAMDPAFRKVYEGVFKSKDIGALLHGRYFDEGNVVRARLELTGLSDGILIGSAELRIPKGSIPAGIAIDPSKAAQILAESIGGLITEPAGELKVSVSTDKGAGAVYREGELMTVLVTATRDAWIKVYHIDSTGKAQLVWPNGFGGSGRIAAGQVLGIPSEGAPFAFKMTQPYGTEFLKVVASTDPFTSREGDFIDLPGEARSAISRGIEIVPGRLSTKPERAEATTSYLIMPRD